MTRFNITAKASSVSQVTADLEEKISNANDKLSKAKLKALPNNHKSTYSVFASVSDTVAQSKGVPKQVEYQSKHGLADLQEKINSTYTNTRPEVEFEAEHSYKVSNKQHDVLADVKKKPTRGQYNTQSGGLADNLTV